MGDLISRDKAVAAVLGTSIEYQLIYGKKEPKEGFVRSLIKSIANIPQEETERKHGRWIPVRSYEAFGGDEAMWAIRGNPIAYYYCSNCRNDAHAGEYGESILSKYCPECGAKMEE